MRLPKECPRGILWETAVSEVQGGVSVPESHGKDAVRQQQDRPCPPLSQLLPICLPVFPLRGDSEEAACAMGSSRWDFPKSAPAGYCGRLPYLRSKEVFLFLKATGRTQYVSSKTDLVPHSLNSSLYVSEYFHYEGTQKKQPVPWDPLGSFPLQSTDNFFIIVPLVTYHKQHH